MEKEHTSNQTQQKRATPMVKPGGPGAIIGGPAEKPKDFKGTLKKLVGYLKPHWLKVSLVIIFAVSSTIFAIVSPKILGHARRRTLWLKNNSTFFAN